jgi:Family of unknown function (DUF5522)
LNRRSVGNAPLPDELRKPHPARLPPSTPGYDAILAAHEEAIVGHEPGYVDPETGLFVMTAAYLWERGECCDSGCRHCPYLPRS